MTTLTGTAHAHALAATFTTVPAAGALTRGGDAAGSDPGAGDRGDTEES